jgi:PKD repeat protein
MVSVANLGDGAIAWTASASEPWLNLSTTTGFTPDIITATVDASALASGEYTGTITVTDTATPASPHGVQIVLTVYELADAVMEATPTSGVAPLTVDFTNQSTGSYNNIAWDFGDGATSTTANTSHTYNQPGVFTANLTISGGLGGTDTISQQIEIFAPVAAVFGAVPTSGVAPLAVAFTNQSSGDFDSCSWDFGDNQTSNQCTGGTHTYTTAGDYTVTLTVSGLGGTDTTTRTVTVSEQPGADARKLSLPLIRR